MTTEKRKPIQVHIVTMIDLAIGWIEMHPIYSAQTDLVSIQVEVA